MERSRLTQEDVRKLMKKYDLSSFSVLAAGDATASNPPPEHIVIYEHTLSEGLIFPLSSFIYSTLAQLCVYPGQLLPNSVRVLIGFELFCFYHDIPCDPHHFFQLFGLAPLGNCFCFLPRAKSPRIHFNLPKPCNQWCHKFFFLKYDMGMFPEKPLNLENWKKYRLDMVHPGLHARFQASRVMDLSKEWDNDLIRNYLKLAQESVYAKYTWRSESDRLKALNDWKKAFEGKSLSRKDYEKIGANVVDNATDRRVGESVGQTNGQEDSSLEGEEEFSESFIYREVEFTEDANFIGSRKRRFSEFAFKDAIEEPAHGIATIHSCSNVSRHDVEGDNGELYGVLGQMPSGGVAGSPITPLGENFFSQILPALGEGPPADMTSLATDMGKITSRFMSSFMKYEEKLSKLRKALDKKTEECQAWEVKFNMSQKDHAYTLLKQEEESRDKLKRCLQEQEEESEQKLKKYLQEQEEEYEQKLKKYLKEQVHERKEYEKLLKNQKEQNEALDAALNKVKAYFLNGLSDIEKARMQRK